MGSLIALTIVPRVATAVSAWRSPVAENARV
jgi:hypothetical protein